jgi:ribonuclease HI
VIVYTDGSVLSSGEGRAGFIITKDNEVLVERVFGKDKKHNTTPNKMELSSVIASIKYLNELGVNENVQFYLDSIYVINGIKSVHSWIESGKIDEIVNKELWLIFVEESKNLSLSFDWLKGHEKVANSTIHHEMNKRVDRNLRKL